MINKLLDNCFLTELNTIVSDVVEENGLYWCACKDTIFYMENGGMRSDIGVIEGHPVLKMKLEDAKQWHLIDEKLEIGANAFMSINLHERFRKCQVHTAQHLISALLKNVYKVKTLAHHVFDDENDIEFDLPTFNDKMASELQVLCNGLIRDDIEIKTLYPTRIEVAKHTTIDHVSHEDIRVIQIGNLDYNLCGCMHVPSLRYLQMIFISGYEKTSNGYKIKYICGDQLLDGVGKRYKVLDEASQTLALSHLYINTGIHKMLNEQKALTRDIIIWKQKYFYEITQRICDDRNWIVEAFDDIDVKSIVQLAQYISSEYKKPSILCAKVYDKCHVVVATNKDMTEDSREIFKSIASKFHLQGGGTMQLAQGGGNYDSAIFEYIKSIQL